MKFICLFCLLFTMLISCSQNSEQKVQNISNHISPVLNSDSINYINLVSKIKTAEIFCKKKGLNNQYCFFVNLSIHSGKKRFYVWDFKSNQCIDSGMVSHGCCDKPWGATYSKDSATASNVMNSHCSSLGKYKVTSRGYSQWGIKVNYKLVGLEETNSNAQKREIVLHSWEAVTEEEVFPKGTPEGWGCPAVSNGFMKRLDSLLSKSKQPILLWYFR